MKLESQYLVDIVLKPETWLLLLEETFKIQSLENFEYTIHYEFNIYLLNTNTFIYMLLIIDETPQTKPIFEIVNDCYDNEGSRWDYSIQVNNVFVTSIPYLTIIVSSFSNLKNVHLQILDKR